RRLTPALDLARRQAESIGGVAKVFRRAAVLSVRSRPTQNLTKEAAMPPTQRSGKARLCGRGRLTDAGTLFLAALEVLHQTCDLQGVVDRGSQRLPLVNEAVALVIEHIADGGLQRKPLF